MMVVPYSLVTGQDQIPAGNWTWLSGNNTVNQVGIYGTQGVASVNNVPSGRTGHTMVIHPSGQLIFVFGGFGFVAATIAAGSSIFPRHFSL